MLCQKHTEKFDKYGDFNYAPPKKQYLSKTPEYKIWHGMKRRCYSPKTVGYHNYGGRGIKVCQRWLEDFANFYDDMGNRPSPKHQIDRIDNDGDYEPGNCRWATKVVQGLNRREGQRAASGVRGVYPNTNGTRWTTHYSSTYIGTYDTIEEASQVYEAYRSKLLEQALINYKSEEQ